MHPLRQQSDNSAVIERIMPPRTGDQQGKTNERALTVEKLESIGRLAGGIAHEINTPTQYVGDNLRFLEDAANAVLELIEVAEVMKNTLIRRDLASTITDRYSALQEDADLQYLKQEIPNAISQSLVGVRQISEIVKAMKNFSHPGSDTPVYADINAILSESLTISRKLWKHTSELKLSLDPNIPLIQCYPANLRQVFLNLITNAAHAITQKEGNDGLLYLSTSEEDGQVRIEIADNGTGMPEQVVEKAFDRNFTTKPEGEGSGQGLFIVEDILCHKHLGTIVLKSHPGLGTQFEVFLPTQLSPQSSPDSIEGTPQ